jgi:CubicO group peptidase (beta-lactamase class C family)
MKIVVEGNCDARFAAVRDAFAANFEHDLELGAALSVSLRGRPVVDIWGGYADEAQTRKWERDTLACIFSCTKGVVAVLALMLADRGLIDLDAPVARYWPEFAQQGKGEIPVRWLLTHQAAVSAIDAPMAFGSLSDWDLMIEALAAQTPSWTPGDGHGYHGVTYGHLVGEVIRRVTGRSCGTAMREMLCEPLGLDIHMPLPEHEEPRTADMVLGQPTAERPSKTFFDHWQAGDLGPRSFRNPPDCSNVPYTNSRAFRAAEIPAANGHGTARSLDRLYAALACGGTLDGVRVMAPALVEEAGREWVRGIDRVMALPTAFGLGFERTIPEWKFGPNPNTFGHNGSGGSLGMVDPDTGLSLGYVMNRMVWGPTRDDPRWPAIFDALYGCL